MTRHEKKYKFTEDWNYLNYGSLEIIGKRLANQYTNSPINILELGTLEGRSALYMFHNYCTNRKSTVTTIDWELEENLEYNLEMCNTDRLKFILSNFFDIIPKLLNDDIKYELIYIDGGKSSKITIFQIVNCWEILKIGGILYFDDFTWGTGIHHSIERPREAILFFLKTFKDDYELIFKTDQVAVVKK